jgi:hypothetical protein
VHDALPGRASPHSGKGGVVSELLEAALRYLPRTIPLAAGTKRPSVGTGWPTWAATSENVTAHYADHPDDGVGIRTGNGLVVIDVDPRHGGDLALARLEREHGRLPATPEVATGGGGRHIYFRGPRELPSRDLRHDGIHGLEIKATGCQVVAPPSIHPESGRLYVWHPAHPLITSEIARLPDWLIGQTGRERSSRVARDFSDLTERDPLHRIPATVYVPALTGRPLNRRGFTVCPFHKNGQERRPALKAYDDGGWKCHACGVGGRIYQLGGLLGGYRLPLTPDARRAIRAELIHEFAKELAA